MRTPHSIITGACLVLHAVASLFAEAVPVPLEFLITPWGDSDTLLVGEDGKVVRKWLGAGPGVCARKCADGGILRMCSLANARAFAKSGPRGGTLERFNAEGRRTWAFHYASDETMMHSDALCLPNGNVLVLFVERKTKEEALARGRLPDRVTDEGLWADGVMEIKPDKKSIGTIVWKWSTWDHLVQNSDAKLPDFGDPVARRDAIDINLPEKAGPVWSRVTGLDYDSIADRVLIVAAGYGECWVIDRAKAAATAPRPLAFRIGGLKSGGGRTRDARWARVPGTEGMEIVAVMSRDANEGKTEASVVHVNPGHPEMRKNGPWKQVKSSYVKLRPVSADCVFLFEPREKAAAFVFGSGDKERRQATELKYAAPLPQTPADIDRHPPHQALVLEVAASEK